jgi:hypothetical protein
LPWVLMRTVQQTNCRLASLPDPTLTTMRLRKACTSSRHRYTICLHIACRLLFLALMVHKSPSPPSIPHCDHNDGQRQGHGQQNIPLTRRLKPLLPEVEQVGAHDCADEGPGEKHQRDSSDGDHRSRVSLGLFCDSSSICSSALIGEMEKLGSRVNPNDAVDEGV